MPLYFNILTRIIQYVGVKKRTNFANIKQAVQKYV